MIARVQPYASLLRLLAPLVWRSEAKIATKLEGFAATEAGSALDMLKAAELTDDPRLRRLFFRHALDEARHAQAFRAAARRLSPDAAQLGSEYNLIHATRQNLFQELGLYRFVAFVFLAERRGEAQFRALRRHFAARPELAALFERIARDERFHVAYSQRLLESWRRQGLGTTVRLALLRVRAQRALTAWRRAGRVIGDALARLLLGVVYFALLPVLALAQRRADPDRPGWKLRQGDPSSIEAARRQY
jgi:rubrerythrin